MSRSTNGPTERLRQAIDTKFVKAAELEIEAVPFSVNPYEEFLNELSEPYELPDFPMVSSFNLKHPVDGQAQAAHRRWLEFLAECGNGTPDRWGSHSVHIDELGDRIKSCVYTRDNDVWLHQTIRNPGPAEPLPVEGETPEEAFLRRMDGLAGCKSKDIRPLTDSHRIVVPEVVEQIIWWVQATELGTA
jgi:hypothetical protein